MAESGKEVYIVKFRTRGDFLQYYCHLMLNPNTASNCPSVEGNSITVSPHVSELKEQLEDICKDVQLLKISESVPAVKEVYIVKFRTRKDFLQYYCHLTLDPNTASNCLYLPEGNREANRKAGLQSYPYHPERFDNMAAVLCEQPLSDCHYWEVDWSGEDRVNIAVTYKEIGNKGGALGHDDKSWRLRCSSTSCGFWHNNEETKLTDSPSSRIGVYLDRKAGILSFYSVSDTMTRLHRIETKFTESLYPAFWMDDGGSVKLVDLESEPEKALPPGKEEN